MAVAEKSEGELQSRQRLLLSPPSLLAALDQMIEGCALDLKKID